MWRKGGHSPNKGRIRQHEVLNRECSRQASPKRTVLHTLRHQKARHTGSWDTLQVLAPYGPIQADLAVQGNQALGENVEHLTVGNKEATVPRRFGQAQPLACPARSSAWLLGTLGHLNIAKHFLLGERNALDLVRDVGDA